MNKEVTSDFEHLRINNDEESDDEESDDEIDGFSNIMNKMKSKARKKTDSGTSSFFYEYDDYDMNHLKRGRAVILNNNDFKEVEGKSLKKRTGTDEDIENLKQSLHELHFEVEIYKNCDHERMLAIIRSIAKDDHSESDCFLCVIMSHGFKDGTRRGVFSADTEAIMLNDFIAPLKRCTSLSGKPKIFIIQACAGKKQDVGNIVADCSLTDNQDDSISNYPKEADVLWVYASALDYLAYRNRTKGSYFILALRRALEKYGKEKNFLHTLNYANYILANDYEMRVNKFKQMCNFSCSLTKNLYFKPKR